MSYQASHRARPPRRLPRRIAAFAAVVVAAATTSQALTPGAAHADPTSSAWAALRQCESSGNYAVVAKNGHYGAYQFDRSTWASVGGTGSPEQASRLEQDYRALYLYRMRGWQPWTCARKLGLAEDAAARSKKVPTYAEAQAVSGATGAPTPTPTPPAPGTSTGTTPAWPGTAYTLGMCATGIKTFQQRMNTLGSPYRFTATGCFESQTRTAVLAVQEVNALPTTGTIDKTTWTAAFGGTNPYVAPTPASAPPATARPSTPTTPTWPGKTYRRGMCAAGIKTFQKQMNALGSPYRFGGTSCYAARTRTAVRAVQRANALRVTGVITRATWNAAFTGRSPWR